MLRTGLIGEFYTMTLRPAIQDRIAFVYRSDERVGSPTLGHPTHTTSLRNHRAPGHRRGRRAPNFLHEGRSP
jgi:hypothetical protein